MDFFITNQAFHCLCLNQFDLEMWKTLFSLFITSKLHNSYITSFVKLCHKPIQTPERFFYSSFLTGLKVYRHGTIRVLMNKLIPDVSEEAKIILIIIGISKRQDLISKGKQESCSFSQRKIAASILENMFKSCRDSDMLCES